MKKLNFRWLYGRWAAVIYATVYSFMAVVGSTMAWITSSDTKVNNMEGMLRLEAAIYEEFDSEYGRYPGDEITKKVWVCNTGGMDLFARISFEEIMSVYGGLPQSGNYPSDSPEYIDASVYSGWNDACDLFEEIVFTESGSYNGVQIRVKNVGLSVMPFDYAIYFLAADGSEQAMSADFNVRSGEGANGGDVLEVYNVRYWGFATNTMYMSQAVWDAELTYPAISRVDKLSTDEEGSITVNYDALADMPVSGSWYYNPNDGFFYYIGRLEPGDVSSKLIDNLELDSYATAYYSAACLKLIVKLQYVQPLKEMLTDEWMIDESSELYFALSAYCEPINP